jgi:hypothetical protein
MKDKLLEKCIPAVENLVRKYNNGVMDEDLRSEALVSVWECLLRSEKDNMINEDEIFGRCVIWARNAILKEVYKPKIAVIPEEDDYVDTVAEALIEDPILISDVRKMLSKKQNQVFTLLLNGKGRQEIKKELNIKDAILRRHIMNIKNVIREHQK